MVVEVEARFREWFQQVEAVAEEMSRDRAAELGLDDPVIWAAFTHQGR